MAEIDVCVCTFRRPSLADTLRSLALQTARQQHTIRIVIADNDVTREAEAAIVAICQQLGLPFTYVHAPARNISIARNACLDAAQAEFAAFIDDDETAEPNWLADLHDFLVQHEADVVFGPVDAIYPPDTAPWLRQWAFHASQPVVRDGKPIETGYTSNVIFRRAVIGGLRFDPAFGRTGGEDTMFFHALFQRSARLAYCPAARVREPVAIERTHMSWILRRAYRSGETHGIMLTSYRRWWLREFAVASAKAGYCLANVAVRWPLGGAWQRYLARAALHVGVAARTLDGKKAPTLS
ncbi:glycosyltransferase family 2 protein [Methylovirgula sp. 4M-Z18]|uniref:glycosyltransferase family 2 protein n=1 Tax=Methylovirgula sp. 4M-Z18 TaxID=2293567 RepID=UPI0013145778|nr:glycosyltransferase family 2 protein [Methylovirgula sp. 4M-Z18]